MRGVCKSDRGVDGLFQLRQLGFDISQSFFGNVLELDAVGRQFEP